ncbi:zinc-dependent alcohol dehydrogenase [Viridibacillus sp. NPDC093762]|uniref:zinc-dependent alcohol dehydrogenase n=1 Tax=Viridibacillus sp. NPDC093762 TaxID=3390720 RepID=UPI003D01AB50
MDGKMKAAVLHGVGDIRIKEMDIPEIGNYDILLKIRAVGICGSDLHSYKTGLYSFPEQIMGHEFCGEVVKIGADVKDIKLGSRVTGFTVSYCGKCYWCTRKSYRLCPDLFKSYSGYGEPGALAEFMKIQNAVLNENVFEIPDYVTDEEAAMAEPIGTAAYTLLRTKPTEQDKVVIIGAGFIGNIITQLMKNNPVEKVIVTEIMDERLKAAQNVGADVVINANETDAILYEIQQHTGKGRHHFGEGGMADIVIDAAGGTNTLNQALSFARSKGVVGLVALPEKDVTIDSSKIIYKDLRVIGILGSMIPSGIDYLNKSAVNVESLITHRFSLDQVNEAFQTLVKDPTALKVIIKI